MMIKEGRLVSSILFEDVRIQLYLLFTTINMLTDTTSQVQDRTTKLLPMLTFRMMIVLMIFALMYHLKIKKEEKEKEEDITTTKSTSTLTTTNGKSSSDNGKKKNGYNDDDDNSGSRNSTPVLVLLVLVYIGIILSLTSNVLYWVNKMPYTWESNLWAIQMDFAMIVYLVHQGILCATFVDDEDDVGEAGTTNSSSNSNSSSSSLSISITIHGMVCSYYTASGIWKINTHFLDSSTSCATIFILQHVTYYITPIIGYTNSIKLLQTILPYGPICTILVEVCMGGFLLLGLLLKMFDRGNGKESRFFTKFGLYMIYTFHLLVCSTPRPHDISEFAVHVVSRMVILCTVKGLQNVYKLLMKDQPQLLQLFLSIYVPLAAYGINDNTFTPLNWAFYFYVPIMGIQFLALLLENEEDDDDDAANDGRVDNSITTNNGSNVATTNAAATAIPSSSSSSSDQKSKITKKNSKKSKKSSVSVSYSYLLVTYVPILFAWFYSYGCLILGLQEEETPNMFANLKVHGGSNHLFLPTGILFHKYYNYYQAAKDNNNRHPYGGGVIRIEETTSNWLKSIYPADLSSIVEPTTLISTMIDDLYHSSSSSSSSSNINNNPDNTFNTFYLQTPHYYFNPGANRVLGIVENGWIPTPTSLNIQYTIPALEFKRLLKEAKQKDQTFTLTYAVLQGTRGDELWRAYSTNERVTIHVKDGIIQKCNVIEYENDGSSKLSSSMPPKKVKKRRKCEENVDIPLLDYEGDTPWLIRHIGGYHSYPIIKDYGPKKNEPRPSIVCFGP